MRILSDISQRKPSKVITNVKNRQRRARASRWRLYMHLIFRTQYSSERFSSCHSRKNKHVHNPLSILLWQRQGVVSRLEAIVTQSDTATVSDQRRGSPRFTPGGVATTTFTTQQVLSINTTGEPSATEQPITWCDDVRQT